MEEPQLADHKRIQELEPSSVTPEVETGKAGLVGFHEVVTSAEHAAFVLTRQAEELLQDYGRTIRLRDNQKARISKASASYRGPDGKTYDTQLVQTYVKSVPGNIRLIAEGDYDHPIVTLDPQNGSLYTYDNGPATVKILDSEHIESMRQLVNSLARASKNAYLPSSVVRGAAIVGFAVLAAGSIVVPKTWSAYFRHRDMAKKAAIARIVSFNDQHLSINSNGATVLGVGDEEFITGDRTFFNEHPDVPYLRTKQEDSGYRDMVQAGELDNPRVLDVTSGSCRTVYVTLGEGEKVVAKSNGAKSRSVLTDVEVDHITFCNPSVDGAIKVVVQKVRS